MGITGLKSGHGPGKPPLLSEAQMAELKATVLQGPDLAQHGVVRWRCIDLRAEVSRRYAVDVNERTIGKWLRKMGLTVYARSMSPATAVGRYATVARNVPVECAGVTVRPGDIIVANEDGVVVIPQERAEEILKKCQEIDEMENKMYPFIKKYKSLQRAIEEFKRI